MSETVRAPEPHQRTWYSPEANNPVARITVFLVDAPISFGHSQLIMEFSEDCAEEEAFSLAAQHIKRCITVFRRVLCKNVASYEQLADYTKTSGSYCKTAILRASANETNRQYKVHLVPLFDSHLDDMMRLHQATQQLTWPIRGGMLHWLGDREVSVDRDAMGRTSVYHERVVSFRLDDLAKELKAAANAS